MLRCRIPTFHWWDYTAADSVILAGPTAGLSPEKMIALEQYVRSGGALLLVESELADKNILQHASKERCMRRKFRLEWGD